MAISTSEGARAHRSSIDEGEIVRLDDFLKIYLDEINYREYRVAARLIDDLRNQGTTVSGSPRVRPIDCEKAIGALANVFEVYRPYFRTGDPRFIERFEALVKDLASFCKPIYPTVAVDAVILHADVRFFMGDSEEVVRIAQPFVQAPYLLEGGFDPAFKLFSLYGNALLLSGRIHEAGLSFISVARWLVSLRRQQRKAVVKKFAPLIGVSALSLNDNDFLSRAISIISQKYTRSLRKYRRVWIRIYATIARFVYLTCLTALLSVAASVYKGRGPLTHRHPGRNRRILVTRAMGGIGDLLMMTAGLRALARRNARAVDLAIPKKFHPIFANNPHVNLIDIDGGPIDISRYESWKNLSICPAGIYENKHLPYVKKGRVELFARGMGVKKKLLLKHSLQLEYTRSVEEIAFCSEFKIQNKLGSRPLIGVQPYSRDSYKDHLQIVPIIQRLAQDFDVVVFHHTLEGLPKGRGIFSTAGISLGNSLALVSILDAMVSVDSAFLHAAAAFDIPVVALFGPTDGRAFTEHHRNVKLLWKPREFGCMPCWRNEDLPCTITRRTGHSPCVAAISANEVMVAVEELIAGGARKLQIDA